MGNKKAKSAFITRPINYPTLLTIEITLCNSTASS